MAIQVIRRPGTGLFGIFSSETNTFLAYDLSAGEVVQAFVDDAADRARSESQRIIEHLLRDEPRAIYYQFTMTWEEAAELNRRNGHATP
ncbi:hypothetical protein ACWEQA_35645 [Nocardia sp. NPDC004085]